MESLTKFSTFVDIFVSIMIKYTLLVFLLMRVVAAQFEAVSFVFYNSKSMESYQEYFLSSSTDILNDIHFDPNKKTVLYIFGYNENLEVDNTKTVIGAYLKRDDYNIWVLNWSNYSGGNYVNSVVPNMVKIGKLAGSSVNDMLETNLLDINKLHLVGHSLGGHMAGYIARTVNSLSNGKRKLKRISALDPAMPLFYPKVIFFPKHIEASDAEFVDVIHTDGGVYGTSESTGTVDFFPNGGSNQPGCKNSNESHCNHARSWKYWAESVEDIDNNQKKFASVKCDSYDMFKQNKCQKGTPLAYMGLNAEYGITGNYYLKTNAKYPFSVNPLDWFSTPTSTKVSNYINHISLIENR